MLLYVIQKHTPVAKLGDESNNQLRMVGNCYICFDLSEKVYYFGTAVAKVLCWQSMQQLGYEVPCFPKQNVIVDVLYEIRLRARFESMSFVVNILACKLKIVNNIKRHNKMVDRIRWDTVSYLPFYYVFFQFLLLTVFNLQANILTTKDILSNLVWGQTGWDEGTLDE